jgi:hypothetical protein
VGQITWSKRDWYWKTPIATAILSRRQPARIRVAMPTSQYHSRREVGLIYGLMLAEFYGGSIVFTVYAIIQLRSR